MPPRSSFSATWSRAPFGDQASAVEELAKLGAQLRYYGRAVVALEAGLADLRFIDGFE